MQYIYTKKTYLLTDEQIETIEAIAWNERVGINELVRDMFDSFIEKRRPTESEIQKYLDYEAGRKKRIEKMKEA